MRLASFRAAGAERFGIVTAAGLVELSGKTRARTLKEFLSDGRDPSCDLAALTPAWGLDEVEWLPPIPNPCHIIGIGLNTRSHFEETAALMKRTPGDYPAKPRLFTRSPSIAIVKSSLDEPWLVRLYWPSTNGVTVVPGINSARDTVLRSVVGIASRISRFATNDAVLLMTSTAGDAPVTVSVSSI